ncbi:hypothetical protein EBZ35_07085 [bacterium]|nr:hypothetical protein [bacterium]
MISQQEQEYVSFAVVDATQMINTCRSTTQSRHDDAQTDATVRKRLAARLQHLDAIQQQVTNGSIELVGFIGWGDACQFKLPQQSGISETHAVVFKRNGQLCIETLGSAISIFDRPVQPKLASLEAIALSAESHQSNQSNTTDPNTYSLVQTHFNAPHPPITEGGQVFLPAYPDVFITDRVGLYGGAIDTGGGVVSPPPRAYVVLPLSSYSLTQYRFDDQQVSISNQSIPRPDLERHTSFRWVTKACVAYEGGLAIKGIWVLAKKPHSSAAPVQDTTWLGLKEPLAIDTTTKPRWVDGVMCSITCPKMIYGRHQQGSPNDSIAVLYDDHLMHPLSKQSMRDTKDPDISLKRRGLVWGNPTLPSSLNHATNLHDFSWIT